MKKTLIFVAIALLASFTGYLLYRSAVPFVQQVDLRLKDARFKIRGKVQPDRRVVVVAIDNKSVKEVGRWPWSREVTARLLTGLRDCGARVVALDMVFSEPQGEEPDRALAAAVKESGNVVLGYFFRDEPQNTDPRTLEQLATAQVKLLRLEDGVTAVPLPEFRYLDGNIPMLGESALDFGFFNVMPDDDGLFRKTPLLALYDGAVYPSLAVKGLARLLGREIMVDVAPFGVRSLALGPLQLPVSEGGRLPLNYYGPAGSFTTVSAADVIARRLPADALRDKLVFVGATEIGISDIRATPFDPALPGVEIHATVAANALDRRFLARDGRTMGIELAVIFLLPAVLAVMLSFAPGTLTGLGYFTCCSGGYLVANHLLFKHLSYDLSIIFPVAPLFLTYLGAEAYRNMVIEKKGRYLKKAFSSYVSADLVAELIKDPDRLKLGGEKREVSILFSDIRGFTTLSESVSPEELVKLLNEYLSPMTRIILDEKGTLDKYIGDAIMAIFNAPLAVAGHAGHACASAVKMFDRLRELNEAFARRGVPQIDIGVGINTGEAVVGNMGADMRFDYTAIGDTVNLASRLESLNKFYGTHILVSAMTKAQVGGGFVFREVDLVRVKGKYEPVAVYELMTTGEELAGDFAEGVALYRNREFAVALEHFSALAARTDDRASRLYVERCREFIAAPPPEEWDGVYVAKSK
jgi:adenylate cyclase